MKKFKTRRNKKYNKLLIFVIAFITFIFLFIYLSTLKLSNSYASFIEYLCSDLKIIEKKKPNILHYLMGNLDYLISDYMFIEEDTILVQETNKPLIYIYSTHDTESYQISSNDSIKPNVITASYMLEESLAKYKMLSTVESKRVSNYLGDKSYSSSYKVSRTFLEEAILKNEYYQYFIDVHRDSVSKTHTVATINDKEYARILFVLGLENKDYEKNKATIAKLNNYLNEHYKGLSRGIYEKSGEGVNGVYNQDFHPNVMLIEIGGVDNNEEEVFNSTQVLAEAFYYCFGDKNEKDS